MSEINDTALNAVYQKGYIRGRVEMFDELKAGKRWWAMYPYALTFGLLVGMLLGMSLTIWLTKWMCQ